MRQLLSVCVVAIALIFASCQTQYKKTKDGLEYKIFPGKNDKDSLLKAGDFIKFHVEYSIKRKGKKDTLISSNFTEGMPGYDRVDTAHRNDMYFVQLFPMMRAGDSAIFRVNVDTLIARNIMQENPMFSKGSFLLGKLSIIEKFKSEADVYADVAKEVNKEKAKEMAVVQQYIKDKNLKTQMTKDSVFVVVENPGDLTAKADSGLEVAVKYEGRLMANDTIFDSNLKRNDSLKIVLGQHMVIPGWESGLKEFGKGGKGKIIVPGFMGYGPQPMGKITPNSNLIFDIQVLDVRKPSPSATPSAPGGQQIDPKMLEELQKQAQQQQQSKTAAPATPNGN